MIDMFEPCAIKIACTVLRRGKRETSYLFQPQHFAEKRFHV
jgi:hypothetical protein